MNQKLRDQLERRFNAGGHFKDVDLHVHTLFSDGGSEAEEVVISAIDKGIKVLGFSDHSGVPGEDWCMTPESEARYRERITELKKKYEGVIDIYCGIEQEALSGRADDFYDFVIGSSHAVKAGDGIVWVDSAPFNVENAVEKYYGGDYYAYAAAYYEGVSKVRDITNCDIVGHFDLVNKFNEGDKMFSTAHPQYIDAWKKAADSLSGKGLIFEVNTGGIARGYRKSPYPADEIGEYLRLKGVKFILGSDSHHSSTVAFEFDRWEEKCLL